MKYKVVKTAQFRKNLKKVLRRGKSLDELECVVRILANGDKLPTKYRDHALVGDMIGLRDCHIQNDWVLLYTIQNDILVLTLVRTGTHSDLGL